MSEQQAEYITDAKEMLGAGYKKRDCGHCRYVNLREDIPYHELGHLECRRHAPQMLSGSGTGWSEQLFPFVRTDDWCGEFQP